MHSHKHHSFRKYTVSHPASHALHCPVYEYPPARSDSGCFDMSESHIYVLYPYSTPLSFYSERHWKFRSSLLLLSSSPCRTPACQIRRFPFPVTLLFYKTGSLFYIDFCSFYFEFVRFSNRITAFYQTAILSLFPVNRFPNGKSIPRKKS